jgi:hypothetical protein
MKYMSDYPVLKGHELTACPPTLGLSGNKICGFHGERETELLKT